KGIYVIGFSYPVVPHGKARIRVQLSAAHSTEDVETAVKAFAEARDELAACRPTRAAGQPGAPRPATPAGAAGPAGGEGRRAAGGHAGAGAQASVRRAVDPARSLHSGPARRPRPGPDRGA